MPRPRTREDGGEAQWGKVEARRGVPREQVGESLLERGREVEGVVGMQADIFISAKVVEDGQDERKAPSTHQIRRFLFYWQK